MTKSVINNPAKLNTGIRYGILEFGEGSNKLFRDFLYMFGDKLDLKVSVCLKEGDSKLPGDCESFICCTFNREEAGKKLSSMGLTYKKDYYWAEDFFCLLDDWKQKKIAFLSYPETFRGMMKSIAFGFAIKRGGDALFRKGSNVSRSFYALRLIPGFFVSIPQFFAKGNQYRNYDYVCFEAVSDAIRFKDDFPNLANKIITVEELRAHTMASSYMSATYYDKRQNSCACDAPYHMLWVGKSGSTRLCDCPDYLDVSCGNIGITDIHKVWQSPLAEIIRLSVINNTYTFCSRERCGKLSGQKEQKALLERRKVTDSAYPQQMNVAIDTVCNLHCPSCRKAICAKNDEKAELEVRTCTDAILKSGWLETAEQLLVGGSGEAFLSKHYKKVIYEGAGKRKSIIIMTNGTLFTLEEWEELEGKYDEVGFMVSVDAATKETYEKVRCGGNFDRLMSNMDFLSHLRKDQRVNSVKVIMIVQETNYREIPEFIRWAKEKGFDAVNLSHIRNWGTYRDDFFWQNVSMFDQNGQMKTELKAVLEDPVCNDPIVNYSWK